MVLGITHAEQGVFAALAAVAAHHVLDDPEPGDEPAWRRAGRWAAASLGGVLVGRAVVEIYLRVNDIVIHNPRTSYLDLGASGFWHEHALAPVALVYALWGPLWLALAWLGWRWWRTGHRWGPVPMVGVVALAALVPVAVTLDETRVYSMITAPMLVVLAVVLSRPELSGTAVVTDRLTPPARLTWTIAAVVVLTAIPGGFTAGSSCWAP